MTAKEQEAAFAAKLNEWAQSPPAFRRDLQVDVSGEIHTLGKIVDDWQDADFKSVDPALMLCAGRLKKDKIVLKAWFERSRGHSKTSDIAVIASWALVFAKRPLKGYCFAADADQAALLRNAIELLLRLNPWMAHFIRVTKTSIENINERSPGFGSTLQVNSSDSASAYGLNADFLICDEVTHWSKEALWTAIYSTSDKRTNCLLLIITNAGYQESWQFPIREQARISDDWIFSRLDGPVASWLTPEVIEGQTKMLPPGEASRLWGNNWTSTSSDLFSAEDVDLAFSPEHSPMTGQEPGWTFIAGLDLGVSRDWSAVVVIAVKSDGSSSNIRLAHTKQWRPIHPAKVDYIEIENHVLKLDAQYQLENVCFDPFQAESLMQRLESDSDHARRNARRQRWTEPWVRSILNTPANLGKIATLTIEGLHDRRFEFYPEENLRRDFKKLRVEAKSYGYRLVSPRDANLGHGDTFSALSVALLVAHEIAGKEKLDMTPITEFDAPGVDADSWKSRLAEYEARKAEEDAILESYRQANGFSYACRTGQLNVITPDRF